MNLKVTKVAIIAIVAVMVLAVGGCKSNVPMQSIAQVPTEPAVTGPAAEVFTVTFRGYDGTVLEAQKVEKGKAATAPAAPVREHFTFAGWDKAFDNIIGDLVVTATYTTTRTVIYAESVIVDKGVDEITVNIRVLNNPGIRGAVLHVSVDDKVLAFAGAENTQYPGLTLTCSGPGTTASPYTFLLDALELSDEDKQDGTLFAITFQIKDTAAVGDFKITLSQDNKAVFDEYNNDARVILQNGMITIQ